MRVLALSAIALLAGFGLEALHGWDGAPAALAAPVALYFRAFGNVRNGLFEGFFYVALGAVFGAREGRVARIPLWAPAVGLLAGVAGCILVTPDAHLPFCVLFGVSAFLLAARRRGEVNVAHAYMRRASTVTYLVHMMFAVLFAYAICGCSDSDLIMTGEVNHAAMFLFALGCSLAISGVVHLLSGRSRVVDLLFTGKAAIR